MPIYMKVEGISGPVAGKYKGWIELQSCQLGVHRNVTSPTGRGTNREATAPSVTEIVITKGQDIASTALFRQSLAGAGKLVVIEFVKGSPATPYLRLTLENTLIANYSVSSSGGAGDPPLESLALNFSKVTSETTVH